MLVQQALEGTTHAPAQMLLLLLLRLLVLLAQLWTLPWTLLLHRGSCVATGAARWMLQRLCVCEHVAAAVCSVAALYPGSVLQFTIHTIVAGGRQLHVQEAKAANAQLIMLKACMAVSAVDLRFGALRPLAAIFFAHARTCDCLGQQQKCYQRR